MCGVTSLIVPNTSCEYIHAVFGVTSGIMGYMWLLLYVKGNLTDHHVTAPLRFWGEFADHVITCENSKCI